MVSPPSTRPELTKADFTVPGINNPDHFMYPLSAGFAELGANIHVVPDQLPLLPDLERTQLGNDEYFVNPGVDLPRLLASRKGAIIEVAGPSDRGYTVLNTAELPSRPIITNLAGSVWSQDSWVAGSESIGGIDRMTLDALADVKHLPFAAGSVGVLLASCLPRLNMGRDDVDLSTEEGIRAFQTEVDDLSKQANKKLIGKMPAEVDMSEEVSKSPRIAFWLEAQRTLEPGGVVIYKGAAIEDLGIAWQCGFKIIAHNERRVTQMDDNTQYEEDLPHEIIFQKIENP